MTLAPAWTTLLALVASASPSLTDASVAALPAPTAVVVATCSVPAAEDRSDTGAPTDSSRARRLVSADATLYYVVDPDRPSFLKAFSGHAGGPDSPPAGADVANAGGRDGPPATGFAESQAERLALDLAHGIGVFAQGQGWIHAAGLH